MRCMYVLLVSGTPSRRRDKEGRLENIVIRVDNDKARSTPPQPPTESQSRSVPTQKIPLPDLPPDDNSNSSSRGVNAG